MSTTIRISDDVDRKIQELGKFGENHDDVLRRVLELKPKIKSLDRVAAEVTKQKVRQAIKNGLITPQAAFKPLILKVLMVSVNQELRCSEVIEEIRKMIGNKLNPMDFEKHESGSIRWENNVQWARHSLIKDGMLHPATKATYGIWKLTEKGVKQTKKIMSLV